MKDIRELSDKELIEELVEVVNSSEGLPGGAYYMALKLAILMRMSKDDELKESA